MTDQGEHGIKTGILKKLGWVFFFLNTIASSLLLFYVYYHFSMQFKLATEHNTCLLLL